ncbi:hypothetical protein PMM47T1_24124 [Pseudomonas sp. M47T1]|uniref:hypothetical protein n=1 Tax=Pseudomonas sp. M47T1 TaxID=1179778 RepID=UPI0002607E00|nr:hypothetical protein [Pseudomonas sp. M47T1]EIK94037.1 hypothetical protein PMM47T1_24124 [Pseudomonas sp. M47T1]
MHPKNSTVLSSAQEARMLGFESELGNCSQTMAEAGTFVWALGSLLSQLHQRELEDDFLDAMVMDGLAKGLCLIGARLMDDGADAQTLLKKHAAFAQGGAQ